VLKIIQNILCVLGVDESSEGQPIKLLDVVILVRLLARLGTSLALQHGPPVFVENQQVWDSLKVDVGVVVNDKATRKHVAKLSNEM
jgi:hypothetical protein